MAVARMSKVTVLGYRSVVDDVVDSLQRADVIQIETQPYELPQLETGADVERVSRLEEYSADAQFVRDFLGRYHEPSQPFSAFISEKIHISTDDFLALKPDLHFRRLYRECVTVADHLANAEREIARLLALVAELNPWRELRLQIQDWRGTDHVTLFAGTVPAAQGPAIRQALRDAIADVSIEELEPVGSRQAWVVMAHLCCVDVVRGILSGTDFTEVSFAGLRDYPAEEIAAAETRIATLRTEIEDLEDRARQLSSDQYHYAVSIAEALESERRAVLVREDLGGTDRAFVATGWMRERDRNHLEEVLAPFAEDLDLTFEEPLPDEPYPVVLDNPRWLRPFETLTDLYGLPHPREVDPTPLLAPFFFLFFGICVSDVGYGAMLMITAYLLKTRLDVAPGVKRFMDLLMYGGLAAMIVGVLFGSYFAIDFEALPSFMQSLRVLDPLEQLTDFLVFCVVLGVVQVFFGVVVGAIGSFRHGDPLTGIFDQLSTIFFFAMIAVAVTVPNAARWALVLGVGLTMLMKGRAIVAAFGTEGVRSWDRGLGVGWLFVTLGALAAFAFTGDTGVVWAFLVVTVLGMLVSRTVRHSVGATLGGAYAVYGMSSFLGDVLSYTRLAALGLSGVLVGWVFNILAGMVWDGAAGFFAQGGIAIAAGVLIVVAAAAVFVFGHVFNVVINLLGAFVHPARLQFVEFFGKFYEGGGQAFAPLRHQTKSVVLSGGAARQEGGTLP